MRVGPDVDAQRYRSLFEHNPDAVLSMDLQGRFVSVNPACTSISGYSRDELVGSSFLPLVVEEDLPLAQSIFERVLGGVPQDWELRVHHKAGHQIVLSGSTIPTLVDGQMVGVFAVAKDVTQARHTEAKLEESEERFRTIFDAAPSGMTLIDLDGRFVETNPAIRDMLGYSGQEFGDRTMIELTHPDDVEVSRDHFRSLVDGDLERYRLEKRYLHKDGRYVWTALTASPVRDAEGRLRFVMGIVEDVTRQKKAEEQLRSAEVRFRTLVEQIPAITYVDATGDDPKTEYVSPQIQALLGVSPDEIVADPTLWPQRIHPEDRPQVLSGLAEHDATGAPFCAEYRVLGRDGEVKWIQDRAVRVGGEKGQPIYSQGVMFDITERKRLEEQLLQAQKMEAVGRLAGGIAHDFNNLLAVIQNYATFLAEEIDASDPRREDVEEIRRASERAANLVRQLLTFSRKEMIRPEILDLNDVAANMEKLLRRTIGEDIELVTDFDPSLGRVRMDVGQVEQVLVNLAVNARDAMPHGGRLKIATSRLAVEGGWLTQSEGAPLEEYACLIVSDTGKGMSRDVASKMFEPFFTTKPKDKGTGLGLAIIHGIVERAGGHISAESAEGMGTTFRIYLPVTRDAETEDAVAPVSEPRLSGDRTVLLVEDEEAVRAIVRRILGRAGYRVIEAEPRDAAQLYAAEAEQIDLLLTDVIMPGISGSEVAGAVRAIDPAAHVLFMSGYAEDVLALHGVRGHENALIAKPFTADELLAAIEQALQEHSLAVTPA